MTERKEAKDNPYCIFKMLRFFKGEKKSLKGNTKLKKKNLPPN